MVNDDGDFLDPDLFKVLDPRIYVMDNGDLFPFLHSTPVFPGNSLMKRFAPRCYTAVSRTHAFFRFFQNGRCSHVLTLTEW